MRFSALLAGVVLAATLNGCANVPFMNDIPMWNEDPAKIAALGKGAAIADVDAALGRTRVLWTGTADVGGTAYQFRLYDWVERAVVVANRRSCYKTCTPWNEMRYDMLPYAIVYVGAQPRLHAWGTLSELRSSTDPAVVAMLPRLTAQYTVSKSSR
jgi:hypothetical protein